MVEESQAKIETVYKRKMEETAENVRKIKGEIVKVDSIKGIDEIIQ